MPPQLREIGFHVENHATQWHGFQHEIQFQEVVVAWIQLTQVLYPHIHMHIQVYIYTKACKSEFLLDYVTFLLIFCARCYVVDLYLVV